MIKFITWDNNKIILKKLLEILRIKEDDMKCYYCGDKLTINDVAGILPDENGKPVTICKSIVCLMEYVDDEERRSKKDD